MKMVQLSAQTLPLFVGKLGERAPALCGAIPAEGNYVAKVGLTIFRTICLPNILIGEKLFMGTNIKKFENNFF